PERFGLEYQAADGSRQRPIMIHRALFGSIERFFGVLTEHYAGAFPAWLAPVQVVGIPIRDDHTPYLHAFVERLRAEGIRAEVDEVLRAAGLAPMGSVERQRRPAEPVSLLAEGRRTLANRTLGGL